MRDAITLPGLAVLGPRQAALAALLVAGALALLMQLALNIAGQIDRLGYSSNDNVQWTLSQMDVELLTLEIIVEDAIDGDVGLDDVRTRFDIAYSRFETLESGKLFLDLRDTRGFDEGMATLDRFIDRTVEVIDGPDAGLRAALPGLKQELRKLIPAVHRMGTIGVEVFARQADQKRSAVKSAMTRLALVSAGLLALLLCLMSCLAHLSRQTRRSATEAAATASRLDAVIGASLDPVLTLDEAGRITGFSPAGTQVFGLAPEATLGRPLSLLIPATDAGPQLVLDPTSGPQRLRVLARHASGRDFPAELSVSTIQAGGGAMFVVFVSDRSAEAEAERTLVQARDTALAGEKAKADLLVLMSHELRTPLNGMLGTVELLQATDLSPVQRDYLRIMADSGRLLMHCVNDILDMSRLDSGKVGLTLAPVDLAGLIREVVDNQRPASALFGNDLRFEPAPACPTHVLGDQGRLRQILLNLVGNAVKFTRDGSIVIRLQRLAEGPFEITVSDTGIGIPDDDLDRIFEDFVTLDPSFARNAAGTGLGLGIVRRIVTRMGGAIEVQSTRGKGSTFRLVLPLEPTSAPVAEIPPPPETAPCPSLRILVVEDNYFNRLIVREMLKQDGHAVTEAANGEEGLLAAETQDFDLILMDISMPGLDGIAATQRLRAPGGRNAATPVLALTAHAMPEDLRRFRAAGMRHVLFKPVDRAILREALAQHGPQPDLPCLRARQTADEMARTLPPEVAAQLTRRFLDDMEQGLATLASATPDQAITQAHHMAGSAGVFGASAMLAALEQLLTRLRAGEVEATRATLPELRALWARTAEAYQPSRDHASSLR